MLSDHPELSPEDNRLIDTAGAWGGRNGYLTAHLTRQQRVVVMVIAAQGVIDNGGLQYFFESNFPGSPPYSQFIQAFDDIGASEAAEALRKAVCVFSSDDLENDYEHRRETMDRLGLGGYYGGFKPLTDKIMGRSNVHLGLLANYIREHGLNLESA